MEKEIQIFDSKTIALVLGVNNIRAIEKRGTLEVRLIQKNCRLIERIKEGKKTLYKVEIIKENDKLSLIEIMSKYKIRKEQAFKQHIKNRYNSIKGDNNLLTQKQFAEKANEDVRNIRKYDTVLLEEKFMKKEGFRYLRYEDGKFMGETSREQYNKYFRQTELYRKQLSQAFYQYKQGLISKSDYDDIAMLLGSHLSRKGEIYLRVPKYTADILYENLFNLLGN